tara:strand:+ start:196 stop:831 length:636 start_codon:yes stop_codon:yes gene_type:complete
MSYQDKGDEDLPEGWQRVQDENGNPYYYHHISRLSRWEKPSKEVAAQHERRLHESMAREAEAVSQRREERRKEEEKVMKQKEAKDAMAASVKSRIEAWRKVHPGVAADSRKPSGQAKSILELFLSVHEILDFVPQESVAVSKGSDTNRNSANEGSLSPRPSDVKKAYMKAVRHIHPDKLSSSLPIETKVLAEAVFVCLTEEYDAWKRKEGL